MRKPWRKILYERQSYPDNHVDPQKFFEDLRLTQPTSQISYSEILLGVSIIIQQLTVVATFFTLYKYILSHRADAKLVMTLDVLSLILIFIGKLFLSEQAINLYQTMKIAILFAICLRIAAPILQILTFSFSKETIHALAITFSFIHLLFHEYREEIFEPNRFHGTLSLNAAMFTAVLLASRLNQIEMVFSFILFAIVSFSLFPQLARLIKKRSSIFHGIVVFGQWLCCAGLLYLLDYTLFYLYQILVAFLLIICPLGWIRMQVFKRSLRGSWDIAQPQ